VKNHGYPVVPVKLLTALPRDATRPEFHRVTVRYDEEREEWTARSTGAQQSSRLLSGAGANGLVRVEAASVDRSELGPGSMARALIVGEWNVPEVGPAAPPLPTRPHEAEAASVSRAVPSAAAAAGLGSTTVASSSSAASAALQSVFELRVAVLTVSDRCASGAAVDLSGPAIVRLLQSSAPRLKNTKITVVATKIVADESEQIQQAVLKWTDEDAPVIAGVEEKESESQQRPHLILTTGGTGFSPRDVTPEAIGALIQRHASGLLWAMMQASCSATPMGALSRPVAGVRHNTLILTLPGSPKAVPEILGPILPLLPHAVKLLQAKDDPHATPSPAPQLAGGGGKHHGGHKH
jgi:gephyrin